MDKCPNCGGPLQRSADGRSVSCPFCGAGAQTAIDAGELARSLRADFASMDLLFSHLVESLPRQLPDHVEVERSGGGFFSSPKPTAVSVHLGADTLVLRKSGHAVEASRKKIVRGIQLKNEVLAVDAWVDALAAGLAELANQSAAAKDALSRLKK